MGDVRAPTGAAGLFGKLSAFAAVHMVEAGTSLLIQHVRVSVANGRIAEVQTMTETSIKPRRRLR